MQLVDDAVGILPVAIGLQVENALVAVDVGIREDGRQLIVVGGRGRRRRGRQRLAGQLLGRGAGNRGKAKGGDCETGEHTGTPPTSPSTPAGLAGSQSHRRSEEHTSELQSLMRISYAVFCLKKKRTTRRN